MYRSTEYKVIILVSKYGCGLVESLQIWMWDYKTSLHRWDELKVCSFWGTIATNILVSAKELRNFFSFCTLNFIYYHLFPKRSRLIVSVNVRRFWNCNVFTALCAMMPYQMEKKWRTKLQALLEVPLEDFCPDSRWLHVRWERDTDLKGFCWSFKVTVATYCTACVRNIRWNSVWKHRCGTKVNEPSTPSL